MFTPWATPSRLGNETSHLHSTSHLLFIKKKKRSQTKDRKKKEKKSMCVEVYA